MKFLIQTIKFIFLIFIFQTAVGLENLSLIALEKKVIDEKLYLQPEWIKLVHYTKSTWGTYRSVVSGDDFFLSKNGKNSPQDELLSTIHEMFSDNENAIKTQCKYLARRDFIVRKLQISKALLHPCSEKEEWVERLGSDRIFIIFAAAYPANIASSFGHTFLRIHNNKNPKENVLLDYSINYAARADRSIGALYALYGLTGFYPGTFSMLPYHHLIREYTNLEGRDLWEFELNLEPPEIKRIIWHLLELEGSHIPYYFIDDNCSFEVLKLLELARPNTDLMKDDETWVVPLDTIKVLDRAGWVAGTKFRPSLESDWQNILSQLSADEKAELKKLTKQLPADNIDLTKEKTRVLDAAISYTAVRFYAKPSEWKTTSYLLAKQRAANSEKFTFSNVPEPQRSPLHSHDAAMFGLGAFANSEMSDAYFEMYPGAHSLLSEDSAVTPYGNIEALKFKLKKIKNTVYLQEFHLVNVLSTQKVNSIDWPLSWGFAGGFDSYLGTNPQSYLFANGKVGFSFDFNDQIRWVNLIRVGWEQDINKVARVVPGFESFLLTRWSQDLRSLIGWDYRWQIDSQILKQFRIENVYAFKKQWEVLLKWQDQLLDSDYHQEFQIGIRHYYIF